MKPADTLQLLPASARRAMPWKNGGGLTYEVTAHPEGGGLTDFDWRVSIAELSSAGPFSLFPGVDRCMAVLEGELALSIGGHAAVVLSPPSTPLTFAGDVPAFGEPRGGPVTDLNLMTRRNRFAARMRRCLATDFPALAGAADTTLIIALSELMVNLAGAPIRLARFDAVRIEGASRCGVSARAPGGSCYLIEISRRPCL